jgi:uncharacterized membrane protein YdbT with pleckstrin-like domain
MGEVSGWYPSKVDWWLGVILGIAPLSCLVIAAAVPGNERWIALISTAVLLAIYAGRVFPMRYAITDEHVIVRHGLVRQKIPLAKITSVRPTRSLLSSPALSLDRLDIKFGEGMFGSALLSPADKQGFLAELAAKAGLERDGDGLVRR